MVIDLEKFSHISFDLWLTLIKSNPAFKEKRNGLLIEYFELKQDQHTVNQTVRKFDLLFNTINETTGGQIGLLDMWMIILHDLQCDPTKMTKENLQGFIDSSAKLFFKYPPVLIDENTGRLFNFLTTNGITLSLLSNTGFIAGNMLRQLIQQLNIDQYFSFQLYSDELGFSKPNQKVYAHLYANVLKIKDIHKSGILHIGDNENADVIGANSFGFASRLLEPNQKITQLFY